MNEREGNMRLRTLLLLSGIGFLTVTTPISARISSAAILHMLDTDNDATVDLAEAQQAGAAVFDRLDSDKDGTLNIDELSGRLTKEEIEAGNPGHKDNLTRDQYLAIVDLRFNGVDSSHDQNSTFKNFRLHLAKTWSSSSSIAFLSRSANSCLGHMRQCLRRPTAFN